MEPPEDWHPDHTGGDPASSRFKRVVLLVTAASLPVLWRTMRPEGLRTE